MQLDPYDYEMIEVVLRVIERADEKITNININQVEQIYCKFSNYVFICIIEKLLLSSVFLDFLLSSL